MNHAVEPGRLAMPADTRTAVQATPPAVFPPSALQEPSVLDADKSEISFDREIGFAFLFTALFAPVCWIGYGFFFPPHFGGVQADTATIQTKAISQVCDAFRVKHGEFPKNLHTLLHRDQFGIVWMDDPNKLIDPWNRPYRYNPKGAKNNGLHADIWTVAPNRTVIGNWPKANRH